MFLTNGSVAYVEVPVPQDGYAVIFTYATPFPEAMDKVPVLASAIGKTDV